MDMEFGSDEAFPRVSVVMGLNRADSFLAPAIHSILNQTFPDFELLIIIDMGEKALKSKIEEIAAGDPRVLILEAPPLGGLALALNVGIGMARAPYIARMDGDDISLPTRLEEQVRYLDEHADVAVLGSRVQMIDEHSEEIQREFPYYGTNEQIRKILPMRNPLPHPALMFRKDAILAVRGYKYGHAAEDFEMFLRIARNPQAQFHNLDKVLFLYRRHAAQGTSFARIHSTYVEVSGFLFTEFLRTYNPKYLAGILIKNPIVPRMRMVFRKLLKRSES